LIQYDIWYYMIYYIILYYIWYELYICQLQLRWNPVAVVQSTFKHKQYTEHNETQYTNITRIKIRIYKHNNTNT
jgi:hypothetical protein